MRTAPTLIAAAFLLIFNALLAVVPILVILVTVKLLFFP